MKKSELVAEVEKLGLSIDHGNHFPKHIAQIWTPYSKTNNKVKALDGKLYQIDILSLDEISEMNERFKKLIDWCHKNNLSIMDVHHIESNLISEIVVTIKNSMLDNVENKTDFELDDTLTGTKEYYNIYPAAYNTTASSLFGEKLTKVELSKIEDSIDDRLSQYTVEDNVIWLLNICLHSNYYDHLKKVFESNLMTPEVFTETLFLHNDSMFYENENEFTKLFSLLTEYKIKNVSILHESDRRGYLPDILTSNKKIMKNIYANWTFDENTTQRILDYMIGDELEEAFSSFIKAYKPSKLDFETNVDQIIGTSISFKTKKIYFDTWVNFKDYDAEESIDLMNTLLSDIRQETEFKALFMNTIIRDEIVSFEEVYKNVVSTLAAQKYNSITNDRHKFLLQGFLKDETLDFTFNKCFIVKVYFDVPAFKAKFLEDSRIVDALIADGDEQYLPDSVKEIFLF